MDDELRLKFERLKDWLANRKGVLVAFSGGVDSSFLAYAASAVKERVRVLLVTGASGSLDEAERGKTAAFAARYGLEHKIVPTREIEDPRYRRNGVDRCFYCKSELFGVLGRIAREEGLETVCDGTTKSDEGEHRPGLAARDAAGAKSPLQELGFLKAEIRKLSREFGLPEPEKPASPCFASRIAYGTEVTDEKLLQVARAETILRSVVPDGNLRVRHHESIARIEVDLDAMPRVLAEGPRIVAELRKIGFKHVTLDLAGYRRGSLL